MDNNTATQAHQQKIITIFFRPISLTHATSLSRTTQTGSQPGHCKVVTIDWAIAIYCACRPQPSEPRSHHPSHQHIKTITSHHHRCFPRFGDLSNLN